MALQDTIKEVRSLLCGLTIDIEKAANGNKAASQRVRTCTVRLEKVAKRYRKESIKAEKSGSFKKPSAKKAAKAAPAKKGKAHPVKRPGKR